MIVSTGSIAKNKRRKKTKKQQIQHQLTRSGFLKDDWDIHQKRCDNDPMYQLLLFPTEPLDLTDAQGNVLESITFIDRILSECIKLIMIRNKGFIEKSSNIKDAFYFLQSDVTDTRCKLFALMFMVQRVPSIRDMLQGLYNHELGPTHSFGQKRFVKLLPHLDKWVEMTLNYAYSEKNIITIVRNFCTALLNTYMFGS